MTLEAAEALKQKIERTLAERKDAELKKVSVIIGPSHPEEFESFRHRWRQSTYVVALSTFAHCDMLVFIEDPADKTNDGFQTADMFAKKYGLNL